MKIAMIGQKGVPAHSGGIERHVEELGAELAKQGHEVLAYCRSWYAASATEHRRMRLVFTPSIRSKHLDAITHTFASIVDATHKRADIIHIHGVGPALLAWLPKLLRPSTKVIVTFHCIDRHHQKWNGFARMMLHIGEWSACTFADATVSVSKALQTYCRLSYGKDTIYIPNGTQIPHEPSDLTKLDAFHLEPNAYLMMCARLVKHKGAHILIDAWKQVKRLRPDLTDGKKLAIVGGGAFTDDYVNELTAQAAGDDSIVLTGAQTGETLHALFANAYAAVHPSESEGLPIAVLEAMSYAKCVLSSDIPENAELTAANGMTFRVGDVNDLAEKMIMLLEHPELVRAVGAEARAHVAKHYDWHDIGEKTAALYEYLSFEPTLRQVTQ